MEIKKLAFILLAGCVTSQPLYAQQTTLKAINDIKRTAAVEGYLTEEKMVPKRDDSVVESCAKGILRKLGGGYTLQDIKPYLHEMVMDRGSRQLVFVYLKKSELGTPSGTTGGSDETQTQVKPRFEIDANGQIVRPRPESNRVSTNVSTTSSNTAATTVNSTDTPRTPDTSSWSNANIEGRLKSIVRDIMLYKNVESVRRSLEHMKSQGRIMNYGLFSESSNLEQQYVVIFQNTRPYAPFAVLSPVQNGIRQNMMTNQTDSVEHYEGYGLMWFTVK